MFWLFKVDFYNIVGVFVFVCFFCVYRCALAKKKSLAVSCKFGTVQPFCADVQSYLACQWFWLPTRSIAESKVTAMVATKIVATSWLQWSPLSIPLWVMWILCNKVCVFSQSFYTLVFFCCYFMLCVWVLFFLCELKINSFQSWFSWLRHCVLTKWVPWQCAMVTHFAKIASARAMVKKNTIVFWQNWNHLKIVFNCNYLKLF